MHKLKSNLTTKETEELQKSVAKDLMSSRQIEKTVAEILENQKQVEKRQNNDN